MALVTLFKAFTAATAFLVAATAVSVGIAVAAAILLLLLDSCNACHLLTAVPASLVAGAAPSFLPLLYLAAAVTSAAVVYTVVYAAAALLLLLHCCLDCCLLTWCSWKSRTLRPWAMMSTTFGIRGLFCEPRAWASLLQRQQLLGPLMTPVLMLLLELFLQLSLPFSFWHHMPLHGAG